MTKSKLFISASSKFGFVGSPTQPTSPTFPTAYDWRQITVISEPPDQ
jgi:hypothetical protein